jgi:hypothetical protein
VCSSGVLDCVGNHVQSLKTGKLRLQHGAVTDSVSTSAVPVFLDYSRFQSTSGSTDQLVNRCAGTSPPSSVTWVYACMQAVNTVVNAVKNMLTDRSSG